MTLRESLCKCIWKKSTWIDLTNNECERSIKEKENKIINSTVKIKLSLEHSTYNSEFLVMTTGNNSDNFVISNIFCTKGCLSINDCIM